MNIQDVQSIINLIGIWIVLIFNITIYKYINEFVYNSNILRNNINIEIIIVEIDINIIIEFIVPQTIVLYKLNC